MTPWDRERGPRTAAVSSPTPDASRCRCRAGTSAEPAGTGATPAPALPRERGAEERRRPAVESGGVPLSVTRALQILVERYGLDRSPPRPRSLEAVARAHGLSRLDVRRLEGRALVALRRAFG